MAKKKKRKQHSGGEPKKKRADSPRLASEKNERGNIGPSGQGTHRGRERSNRQTGVSGRPDVSSAGKKH